MAAGGDPGFIVAAGLAHIINSIAGVQHHPSDDDVDYEDDGSFTELDGSELPPIDARGEEISAQAVPAGGWLVEFPLAEGGLIQLIVMHVNGT